MTFKQTKYKGYDTKAIEKFYKSNHRQLKKMGKSDEEADRTATFFVEYYKHQFRVYGF